LQDNHIQLLVSIQPLFHSYDSAKGGLNEWWVWHTTLLKEIFPLAKTRGRWKVCTGQETIL